MLIIYHIGFFELGADKFYISFIHWLGDFYGLR